MLHDLDVLLDGLAHPDAGVRDGWAYAELAEGITAGRFDEQRETIREAALTHLHSNQIYSRAFAPLMLAWLVGSGDRSRAAYEAVCYWYPIESDTRGYDDELGWLHAVAHGADYLGLCAQEGIATGPEVLDVLALRMIAPGDLWQDQEDARVAHAAVLALQRCDEVGATAWTTPIMAALSRFEENPAAGIGRPPSWPHNVYATSATLYVALAEQPRDGDAAIGVPHGRATRSALAELMSRITPWLLSRQNRGAASSPS